MLKLRCQRIVSKVSCITKCIFLITSLTALIFPFRHLSLHSRVHDGYQGEEEDLVGGGGEADQVDQDHDQEGGGDGGHGGRVDLEQCVDKKNIQPKMFKDIQTEDFQTKDIQRYSNHLEECLGHRLAKYVSRYTAVHT